MAEEKPFDRTKPVVAYVRNCHPARVTTTSPNCCRPRYFLLMLYPEVISLREAIKNFRYRDRARSRRKTPLDDDHNRIDGVFHPTPFRAFYDKKTKTWTDTTSSFAGVMRLHAGRMDVETVTHECTHAALHMIRLHDWGLDKGRGNADFGDGGGPHEEDFAYLLGDITDTVARKAKQYLEKFDRSFD